MTGVAVCRKSIKNYEHNNETINIISDNNMNRRITSGNGTKRHFQGAYAFLMLQKSKA